MKEKVNNVQPKELCDLGVCINLSQAQRLITQIEKIKSKCALHKEWVLVLRTFHKYCPPLLRYSDGLKKKNMRISNKDLEILKKRPGYCLGKLMTAIKKNYDKKHLKDFIMKHKDLVEYFI